MKLKLTKPPFPPLNTGIFVKIRHIHSARKSSVILSICDTSSITTTVKMNKPCFHNKISNYLCNLVSLSDLVSKGTD